MGNQDEHDAAEMLRRAREMVERAACRAVQAARAEQMRQVPEEIRGRHRLVVKAGRIATHLMRSIDPGRPAVP